MLRSCITTSMNSATCGRTTKLAMRAAPSSCGFTTRSAPARASLATLSSWRARATTNMVGLSVRAESVTNRFAASSAKAATSARARSTPAARSVVSRVASPTMVGWITPATRVGSLSITTTC